MLSKILGLLSIVVGVIWLIKPEVLKNRLKKKVNRKIRRIVYGFIAVFGFLIITSVFKAPGLLPKLVGIIGLVIVIKAVLSLTSKSSDKLLVWLQDKPLTIFRVWALFVLTLGLMLFLS